jgi:hypothetical protein
MLKQDIQEGGNVVVGAMIHEVFQTDPWHIRWDWMCSSTLLVMKKRRGMKGLSSKNVSMLSMSS